MIFHSRTRLIKRLKDKRFRDAFVSSRIDTGLAFQIRALRQKEKFSQEALGEKLGTSQNAICRLESPDYGRASISTLKKIASVFDVALVVRFVRFSTLVNDILDLSTESVIVDKFEEDKGLEPPSTVDTPTEAEVASGTTGPQEILGQIGIEPGPSWVPGASQARIDLTNATPTTTYH